MKVNYSTFLNGELLTKLILGLIAINIIGYGYNKITFMTNGKDFTFMWINLREIFVNNENVSKEI